MADTNKENDEKKRPIYKYGEHELDLGNYIHNLGTNLNNYLDTVKKNWSEDQKEEFTTAFDKYLNGLKEQMDSGVERFSTNNYGRITDLKGELSNTDDDGIDPSGSEYYYNNKGERITTDDYNRLKNRHKKDYKVFSANKEVAKYFKEIGERIKNKQPKPANTVANYFDFNKHGFVKYFMDKYNPTGGEFDRSTILTLDPFDETTGKRSIAKRTDLFGKEIDEHLAKLDPTIDWSKTQWGNADEYKKYMQGVKQSLSDGLTEQDYLDYGRGGMTRPFLETFNYTGKEFLTPQGEVAMNEQKKAEEEAAKKKEQEEKYGAMMNERFNIYKSNAGEWDEHNPYALGSLLYWDPTNGWNQSGFDASFNIKDNPEYYDSKGNLDKAKFNNYVNDYLTGNKVFTPEGRRALSAVIGSGRHEVIESGPHKGKYYIPQISDRTTNTGLVYNPTTGGLQKVFIGDLPSQAERIKREWMESEGIVNRQDRYKLFKEGGTIDMMQLGGGFNMGSWMDENREKELKERADKEDRTVEQQKAGERKTNSDAKDPSNPDAEWKATDTARVASALADIGSMVFSFLPGAGTAIGAGLGIGSSLTTFGADWAEDGLDWGDFKSLGANLGLDVLGLIPGGGAASKGVKIAKTLGKYASRAMAAVATYQGLSNANNIIQSINKMTTDPTNLTVDDWRNISQGFGLLTGGVAAGTRKVKKTIAEADMKAKAKGAVAVELIDKQGNTKMVAFDGNDAVAIKKAQQSGNLDELRKATVGKYEQFRDWDLATTGNTGWRSVRGDEGWQLPWGAKEGKARIFDMYGDKNGKLFTRGGNWQADVKTGKPIDSNTELQTATVDKAVEVNKKALLDKLKNLSDLGVAHEKKLNDVITSKNKAFKDEITQKQEALNTANATNDPNQITAADNALQDALSRQQDWQARRARLQQTIADIRAGKYYDNWKSANLQGTGNDAVLVVNSNPYNRPAAELAFAQILDNLNIKPKYFTYAKGGRIERIARFQGGGNTTLKNVINPGDWFNDMFMSPYMQSYFNTLDPTKEDTWKNFNNLQNSWSVNKNNTGYSGQYAIKDKTNGVTSRQQTWNKLGINPAFESIKGLVRNGGTKDNPEGGYVDGVFGAQENFRHFGNKEYFDTNPEALKQAQGIFNKLGFDYSLNSSNNMYEISPVKSNNTPEKSRITTPVKSENYTYTDVSDETEDVTTKNKRKYSFGNIMNTMFNDPTIKYGIPKMLALNMYNKRMINQKNKGEIPVYIESPEHIDTIHTDLSEEMRGIQNKAELLHRASKPLTSDASLYMAAMGEAARVGLGMQNESMAKSSAIGRETAHVANEHKYEDRSKRINANNINKAAGISTLGNINNNIVQGISMEGNNLKTWLQEKEYQDKVNQAEIEPQQDALIKSDIHDTALRLAATDGESLGLTPEQVEAYKLLQSGTNYEDLTPSQKKAVISGNNILKEFERNEWSKHKGLRRYDKLVPLMQSSQKTPVDFFTYSEGSYKNGGKIAVAGIRARTADAERFQKLILESIKRHDKALDRLSKSTINYVKDIMK